MVKRKAVTAVSKTKALATRRRKSGPAYKAKTESKPSEVLTSELMEKYLLDENSATSFADILSGLGMNNRNTGWRKAWQGLKNEELIEQVEDGGRTYRSAFRLTGKGREEASTDEIKQVMKAASTTKPKTNEDTRAYQRQTNEPKRGADI